MYTELKITPLRSRQENKF